MKRAFEGQEVEAFVWSLGITSAGWAIGLASLSIKLLMLAFVAQVV